MTPPKSKLSVTQRTVLTILKVKWGERKGCACGYKRQEEGSLYWCAGGFASNLVHCINVNIPFVILYYSFIKCHQWGSQVKGTRARSVLFLVTAHESTIISKKFKLIKRSSVRLEKIFSLHVISKVITARLNKKFLKINKKNYIMEIYKYKQKTQENYESKVSVKKTRKYTQCCQ